MAYETFILHGGPEKTPGGTIRQGEVRVKATAVVREVGGGVVFSGLDRVVLNEAGMWSFTLPCTDDPGLLPEGFRYELTFHLSGSGGQRSAIQGIAAPPGTVSLDAGTLTTTTAPAAVDAPAATAADLAALSAQVDANASAPTILADATSNPVLAAGEPGFATDTGDLRIGDGASTWDALPDTHRALTVAAGNSTFAAHSEANAPARRAPDRARPTWITTFQTGHGWVAAFGGGEVVADTTDFVIGTQSLRVTNNGADRSVAVDLTGKALALWVKIDTLASGNSLVVYAADAGFTNYYAWTVRAGADASAWFKNGEWALVTLPVEDAVKTGAPTPSGVARLRVRTFTQGVIHINAIGTVPTGKSKWPNGLVSITFDDGYDDFLEAARKSMTPRGLTGTAFLIPTAIDTTNFMTLAQVKELHYVHGWDLQAHGLPDYTTRTATQLREEWTATKQWFTANGFGRPEHLAYPGGQNDDAVVDVAREFFTTARTIASNQMEVWPPAMPHRIRALSSISGFAGGVSVANVQAAIDDAKAGGHWLILVFHRVVDAPTSTIEVSWTDLNTILDYIVSSGVEVRTYSDAFRA